MRARHYKNSDHNRIALSVGSARTFLNAAERGTLTLGASDDDRADLDAAMEEIEHELARDRVLEDGSHINWSSIVSTVCGMIVGVFALWVLFGRG